jgi:hypothetical protein
MVGGRGSGFRTDESGTAHDGSNSTSETSIEYHGQRFINDDIRQQQGHENPVFAGIQ